MSNNTFTQSQVPLPVLHMQGNLDRHTYLDLIENAKEIYESGQRHLILDMSEIPAVGFAGLFGLYSVAMIFNGETPLDPAEGQRALHTMAEKVIAANSKHFVLLTPRPAVGQALSKSGLPMYEDLDSALDAF